MKQRIILILMSVILLAGCTLPIYKGGVKPIYPGVGNPNRPETVDSLSPKFQWESDTALPCNYDFAIWDVVRIGDFWKGRQIKVGAQVYYREALPQSEHKIEIQLGPDSEYFWSIRTRSGGKVSEWSTYDYHINAITMYVQGKNWPYVFRTPNDDSKKE